MELWSCCLDQQPFEQVVMLPVIWDDVTLNVTSWGNFDVLLWKTSYVYHSSLQSLKWIFCLEPNTYSAVWIRYYTIQYTTIFFYKFTGARRILFSHWHTVTKTSYIWPRCWVILVSLIFRWKLTVLYRDCIVICNVKCLCYRWHSKIIHWNGTIDRKSVILAVFMNILSAVTHIYL